MATAQTYTFAINQVDIAPYNNGAAVTQWLTIPVVGDSSVSYNISKSDVPDGESNLIAVNRNKPRITVNLEMKRFHFRALEMMTGSPVSSYQGADAIQYGTDREKGATYFRLRAKQMARDGATDTSGYAYITIYKCQGVLPSIPVKAVTPGVYQMSLSAVMAYFDESGNAIEGAMLKFSGPTPIAFYLMSLEVGPVDAYTIVATFSKPVIAVNNDYVAGWSFYNNGFLQNITSGTRQTNQTKVYYVIEQAVEDGDSLTATYAL